MKKAQLPTLRVSVDKVLAHCEQVAGESATWTLVSALAEGADRIAAWAALDRGWSLKVPLPFAKRRYIEDFDTPESRDEFALLCERAENVWVVRPKAPLRRGYEAVGLDIVGRSDLLIAMWNGAAPEGPGGTASVIKSMLMCSKSVVWIDTRQGNRIRLLVPEHPAPSDSRAQVLRLGLETRLDRGKSTFLRSA
ncbi:MAG: hypothetical protein V7741_01500 [Hyphomonas sp.]